MGENDYKSFILGDIYNDEANNPIVKNWELIDSIDLMPYIEAYNELADLMFALRIDYDNTLSTDNAYCNGKIFNWIDIYELALYIKSKYGVTYKEKIITKYIKEEICEEEKDGN